MKSTLSIAALVALLAFPPSADALRSGGHNPPTRKLELAFKVMGGVRAGSKDGCYPDPRRAVRLIDYWSAAPVEVAPGLGAVRETNVVYVIAPQARLRSNASGPAGQGPPLPPRHR